MPIQVRPDGPIPARIMLVGEAPGADEEIKGLPFVGASGMELTRMLSEAGIPRGECFITNVCRERPPDNDINLFMAKGILKPSKKPTKYQLKLESKKIDWRSFQIHRGRSVHPSVVSGIELLKREISMVKPNIIVAFGNTPLWALTGQVGITKWRGSMMTADFADVKVIPTLHPAAILRQWSDRVDAVQDLKRAALFRSGIPYPRPRWNFKIRPVYAEVLHILNNLLSRLDSGESLRLSFDLETRAGHIACAGISYSLLDAICIPFMCVERRTGYWTEDEEHTIVQLLRRVLTHKLAEVVGQNILYDAQYTWRWWRFVPRIVQDCMISQHSIFSDKQKSLGYQASVYCNYYYYWKDEGKNWDPALGENQLWYYNCQDCVYTDEAGRTELNIVKQMGLEEVHNFQQSMLWPVLKAMLRGAKIDLKRRAELISEVQEHIALREQYLIDVLGHPINPRSSDQMMKLFYDDLKQPIQMTRAKKGEPARPTLDDDALQKIAVREPLLKPLINCISDIRTLGIFLSNFLTKPLDTDGRMRCSYNIGGSESGKSAPKTYRLSSSENAFGSGTNLQNIPSEKSKSVGKAVARGAISGLGDAYQYPNIRSMFIPDFGHTFFDGDLDRADLQVVVWESNDAMLKAALRMGVDIHLLNAFVLEGKDPPPLDELVETHPKYRDHRGPRKLLREFAKVFCHGTNYGGGARTMAAHTGRTVAEIDRAQKIWFGAHPGIKQWHDRVKAQVTKYRFVENKFGYRWYIFDRIDSVIPEAIAWVPQSTVSIVINKIWTNIYNNLPDVEVLLQVHDSLAGQFPSHMLDSMPQKIKEQARIVIPYEDPLVIPFGLKLSDKSWGDCK